MSEIFDLDAHDPDLSDPLRFTFGGVEIECRPTGAMDIRRLGAVVDAAERNPTAAIRMILDDENYELLDQVEKTFTAQHLMALAEAWVEHGGMSVPKSGGSPTPPAVTRMR